jgi:hypothetical protein
VLTFLLFFFLNPTESNNAVVKNMKTQDDLRRSHRIFPKIKIWGSFALVVTIFGSYAYFLKMKESGEQKLFLGEMRYLRQENHSFAEKIQELEQQCGTLSTEAGTPRQHPPIEENSSETATERSFVYQVKRGDTIWDIAAMYQVDVKALMHWNNLTPRSRIFPGDELTIILEE